MNETRPSKAKRGSANAPRHSAWKSYEYVTQSYECVTGWHPFMGMYLWSFVWGSGQLSGSSAGLEIERLRVRILVEAAGEFSSPELTFCADSYSVSVSPPFYRSGT